MRLGPLLARHRRRPGADPRPAPAAAITRARARRPWAVEGSRLGSALGMEGGSEGGRFGGEGKPGDDVAGRVSSARHAVSDSRIAAMASTPRHINA